MVDNNNIQFNFYRSVLINFFSFDYLLQMILNQLMNFNSFLSVIRKIMKTVKSEAGLRA